MNASSELGDDKFFHITLWLRKLSLIQASLKDHCTVIFYHKKSDDETLPMNCCGLLDSSVSV